VKSEHMVQTVKPGFAASGWIYAGNQYGDGTVGLQVVLAGDDKVVDPATVLKVLKSLHVPHRFTPSKAGTQGRQDDGRRGV